jgi:hypothetical protein
VRERERGRKDLSLLIVITSRDDDVFQRFFL